ncbi:MAG TPA: FAD binding domain-containing protein [Solirubrobacteraceae bacterium]|nr:FAD binding domain-containing protein [Solirubrobacteraceae bacterium]
MKPSAFEYLAPESCDEVLAALAGRGDDAAVLAGGQSLIPMMNLRIAAPPVVIDIMRIAEFRTIERGEEWIEIGAGIRMAQAERESASPLIEYALKHVGHAAIRNAGTVCGSIAHADPAAELPAVLLALDGEVVLRSTRGVRAVAADDFFRSYFTTAREPDELVVAVRIPTTPRRVAFLEVTPRLGGSTGEFATVAVAAAAERDDAGRFASVSLAFAGVAERAIRAREAETLLAGAEPTGDAIAEAAERAADAVDPPEDVHAGADYRRELVRALTRRALGELASR